MTQETADLLNRKFEQFNDISFIENDPISIPHLFSNKQDIEIAGFFAATFAWGQRKTIIKKTEELLNRMDNAPFQFVTQAKEIEYLGLESFVHRTFNFTDLLHFIRFFKNHYQNYESLESAFLIVNKETENIKSYLINFRNYFFSLEDSPNRTKKHVSTPQNKSACKRINMFLRWMVRSDNKGVDFGIWQNLKQNQLIIPCDLHVERIAKKLNLTARENADWQMAEEITENLKELDKNDPAKYDFALFGMGIENYFLF